MNLNVLDCTFRDGGYYGDWNFDRSLVDKYLLAVSLAKIDIIEIGFRFIPQEKPLGPFAYSTDEFLNELPLPDNVKIAVMINAQELISHNNVSEAVNALFTDKRESPVDIVRIATHFDNIEQCYSIAKAIHGLGYQVFLNLMQIDSIDKKDLQKAAQQVQSWNCIDVLYFADSFGNMNATLINEVVESVKMGWSGDLGIHAHDNKGHALVNSIAALDYGVNYIDATLLGMGRGAGNTKIENLLVEIADRNLGNYNPSALFPLVLKDFEQLQKKYNWGSSVCYFLSAVHGIHPTYIQEMLGDERYDIDQILSAIDFLKFKGAPSYSLERMLKAISSATGSEHGSWSAKDWAKDRNVLIIGSGPSIEHHIDDITKYTKEENPIVFCLNINKFVPENIVNAYVACHETRISMEADLYSGLTKPIILPMSRIPKEMKELLSGVDILDYGLRVEEHKFQIFDNGCVLDSPLALMYALSLTIASGAKKILLAGIDGYDRYDQRQQNIVNLFLKYKGLDESIPIFAITPTTFEIDQNIVDDKR